jgi:phosphate starvation-inducible protein PhoH
MGRKSTRNQRQQQRMSRAANARDPRFDSYEEETTYGYATHRVKHQRYPQPIPATTPVLRMNRRVEPKNQSQEFYLDALRTQRVVFGSGSAGSGKTLLAVGVALEKLLTNEVSKIVFTRPIVEAGENLGFLPGTLEEKVLPYMMPMLDAIEHFVGPTAAKELIASERIVFKPLAYLRGNTLGGTGRGQGVVAIFDETQNSTPKQMQLFLTRLGYNCFMFLTGDPVQSDLKEDRHFQGETGLEWAVRKFRGGTCNHVEVVEFSNNDVVRDPVMADMLRVMSAPEPKINTQVDELGKLGAVSRPVPAWRDGDDWSGTSILVDQAEPRRGMALTQR